MPGHPVHPEHDLPRASGHRRRRLAWSVGIAVGAVLGATVAVVPS